MTKHVLTINPKDIETLNVDNVDTLLYVTDLTTECQSDIRKSGRIDFEDKCFIDISTIKDVLTDSISEKLEDLVHGLRFETPNALTDELNGIQKRLDDIKNLRDCMLEL